MLVLLVVAGATLDPLVAWAQRAEPVRIGVLTESWGPTPATVGLRDGLQALGYREGEQFHIGVRFTQGDLGALPPAARELIAAGVDVIFATSAELALLEDLHRHLGAQQLAIIAVNVRESSPVVREYVEALGLTFAVLLDPRGEIQRSYGVIGLPTTFVIARDGRAVARAIGPRDWAGSRSRELLRTLLHERASPAPPLGTGRR